MRGLPLEARDHAQGAVAAALDVGPGRLAQDRQVGLQPPGVVPLDAPQAVEVRGHLLVVVEDPRGIRGRRLPGPDHAPDPAGGGQGRGHPALHVDAAAPPDGVAPVALLAPPGDVVRDGDGVEVPGDGDPRGQAQAGARAHGVPVAQDLQPGVLPVARGAQGGLHRRGGPRLVAGDGRQVHEGQGEGDGVVDGKLVHVRALRVLGVGSRIAAARRPRGAMPTAAIGAFPSRAGGTDPRRVVRRPWARQRRPWNHSRGVPSDAGAGGEDTEWH